MAPVIWLTLVITAVLIGRAIGDDGAPLYLGAAPFAGDWDLRGGVRLALPVLVGGAAALTLPRLAETLAWRRLLALSVLVAVAWAVSLALVDGTSSLTAPLTTEFDYLADVGTVRDLGVRDFLSSFTGRIGDYAVHTRGHPPGLVVLAALLGGVGLGSAGVIAAVCIGGGASATAAAAIVVRVVASEDLARRAVPFLALAPAAIWVATSADALYLGVATWGLVLLALASRPPVPPVLPAATPPTSPTIARLTGQVDPLEVPVESIHPVKTVGRTTSAALAAAGGVVLGLGLHLSYGVAPLGLLAVALLVRRRTDRAMRLAAGAAGVAAVTAVFVAAGFRWWDGLAATREQWALGVGPERPQAYFLLANLAAFAVAIGPAAVSGLTRLGRVRSDLRGDRGYAGLALLALGGTAAVTVANLSGISRGEVERIWLPFTPWLVAAAATLDRRRGWLAVQVGTAVALQAVLVSKW